MSISKTIGLVAAPPTPMAPDGAVALPVVDRIAELFVRNKLAGAFCCGSTGEAASLTLPERMAVAERWAAAAGKSLRVMVHVGHNCLGDAQALAAHAQKIGAYAIGAFAPSYFRPSGVPELVEWCAAIAAAAPALPFYYYHIPSMTGVNVRMAEFLPAAAARIPTLAGAKFTHTDFMDLGLALECCDGRLDVLYGYDEVLLCGLALGVRGAIGSTYSFQAPLNLALIRAFDAGDLPEARRLQGRSRRIIACLLNKAPGALPHIKAAMRLVGVDCGPVRPPLANLSDAQFAAMREAMAAEGFDELRSR